MSLLFSGRILELAARHLSAIVKAAFDEQWCGGRHEYFENVPVENVPVLSPW